jgi:hypothetical protein
MASPKNPVVGQVVTLPVLTDPNSVQEAYSNQLVGIGIRDGIVHITLSIIRPRHNNPGGPSDDENVVVARDAMPTATMNALCEGYQQLLTAMQIQQQLGKLN